MNGKLFCFAKKIYANLIWKNAIFFSFLLFFKVILFYVLVVVVFVIVVLRCCALLEFQLNFASLCRLAHLRQQQLSTRAVQRRLIKLPVSDVEKGWGVWCGSRTWVCHCQHLLNTKFQFSILRLTRCLMVELAVREEKRSEEKRIKETWRMKDDEGGQATATKWIMHFYPQFSQAKVLPGDGDSLWMQHCALHLYLWKCYRKLNYEPCSGIGEWRVSGSWFVPVF